MKSKFVYLSFIFLLLCNCSNGNTEKNIVITQTEVTTAEKGIEKNINNDLHKSKLYGKVKSIKEVVNKALEKSGEVSKGEVISYGLELFDESGNNIMNNRYNSDSILVSKCIFIYDNKGKNTEIIIFKQNDSLVNKTTLKYDDRNYKIEEKCYNPYGNLEHKTNYKYDSKGNNIEEKAYKSFGRPQYKITHHYDDNGFQIEENLYSTSWYNPHGSLDYKFTYKYDSKGNFIEFCFYSFCNSDCILLDKTTYKYDDSGNIIEEYIDSPKNIYTYKYEYAENGNWIKRIKYNNEITQEITERTIEYFQ